MFDVPESHCVLTAAARPAQAWRNGGGITYEIARRSAPDDPEHFIWRVSIAEVERDGPFSSFAGLERLIAVIEGQGMELHGLRAAPAVLRPFEVLAFSGDAVVSGRLTSGPVKDFNVIFDRAQCRAKLQFLRARAEQKVREAVVVNLARVPARWHFGPEQGELGFHDAVHVADTQPTALSVESERAALVVIESP